MYIESKKITCSLSDLCSGLNIFIILFFTVIFIYSIQTSTLSKDGAPGNGHSSFSGGLSRGVVFMVIGGFLLGVSSKFSRRKKMIDDIPTSKIKSMAMGLVELTGRAKKINELISPVSAVTCVFYRYVVERKKKRYNDRGYAGRNWVIEKDIYSKQPFYIDDTTGQVIIDPDKVEFHSKPRNVKYEGGGFLGEQRRFTEWYLLHGENVYVIGTAKKYRDFMQEFRIKVNQELRKLKENKDRMMTFDENKDGAIDAQEWDQAAKTIEEEMKQQELTNDHVPQSDIAVGYSDDDELFFVSDESEKDLVKSFGWIGMLYFTGSIAAFLGGIIGMVPACLKNLF